jgi:hypothetical protein
MEQHLASGVRRVKQVRKIDGMIMEVEVEVDRREAAAVRRFRTADKIQRDLGFSLSASKAGTKPSRVPVGSPVGSMASFRKSLRSQERQRLIRKEKKRVQPES